MTFLKRQTITVHQEETRTAQRKRRKLEIERVKEQKEASRRQLTAPPDDDSADEEDIATQVPTHRAHAYEALLASLTTDSKKLAEKYILRKRQQAGLSDEEDDNEEEEEEDEDQTSEEEEEEELADAEKNKAKNDNELCPEVVPLKSSKKAKQPAANQQPTAPVDVVEEHYFQHFDYHQLTDIQLAQLAFFSQEADCHSKYQTVESFPSWSLNTSSTVQATPNALLPSTHHNAPLGTMAAYGVKERLASRWRQLPHSNSNNDSVEFVDEKQEQFFSVLNSYVDVFHSLRPYATAPNQHDPEMDAVLLHILNHCAKSADKIKKNNEKIKGSGNTGRKKNNKGRNSKIDDNGSDKAAAGGDNDDDDPTTSIRDQGFARPKILLLLPMRNIAHRVISRLVDLAVTQTRTDSVQNKQRFNEEFGPEEGEEELDAALLNDRAKEGKARKPAEFQALFHHGNLDDHFRLGVKLTRGAVKLYADFFQSDIIVASPLGLATLVEEAEAAAAAGAGGGGGEKSSSKKGGKKGGKHDRDHDPKSASRNNNNNKEVESPVDFLSSIEICIMERADVMAMQNWSHISTVFGCLNRIPKQQRDVDIMRVREWVLSGAGKHYRQTVVMSSFPFPEAAALMRKCSNYAGKVKLKPEFKGVLGHVIPQARQVFERLNGVVAVASEKKGKKKNKDEDGNGQQPSTTFTVCDADARFEHFCKVAWPRIQESARGDGQLIYVPSYFDYVRVRNYLKSQNASFLGLSEYSDRSDGARARSFFYDGRKSVLLYTERAQFYGRHTLKGVKDILFYQLPQHAHYYSELMNFLEESASGGVPGSLVMFSKLDAGRLEAVVGSGRAKKMLKGATGTFLFC